MGNQRTPLTVELILSWADHHHARAGRWPGVYSGAVLACRGQNWKKIDNALRMGLRGLQGRSSLARLLDEHRGTRTAIGTRRLTEEQVVGWARAHHERTGVWPNEDSGPVEGVPGEDWYNLNAALANGHRGLPGNDSLAKLLARHLGVRTRAAVPRLTVAGILAWADAWKARTGSWPKHDSGAIPEAPGETWDAVESALRKGAGGSRAAAAWRPSSLATGVSSGGDSRTGPLRTRRSGSGPWSCGHRG